MDGKKLEFVRAIDRALEIAEQARWNNRVEELDSLIGALQSIKNKTIANRLEPSQGVLTLGLSRGVVDWIDSFDAPLLEAVGAIEQHYQKYL